MGLDTSHDAWHGAYSAFGRWRLHVVKAAGYETVQDGPYTYAAIDWDAVTKDNLAGKWEAPPADPLMVLIAHSDCDGQIMPEDAARLADRLEELLPAIEASEIPDGGHIGRAGGYAGATRRFIAGCRAAASAGEPIDFH
jgi:hypothetical protein